MTRLQHSIPAAFQSGLLTLLLLCASAAEAQPRVLTSLKPLQLIAAAVMDGAGEPLLLTDGAADPHHHSLRPSERRQLEDADLLLWVGPGMEGWLEKVVPSLDARSLAALQAPGLEAREGPRGIDAHVWLDSGNARHIAAALAQALSELDPAQAARYQANLRDFEAALDETDADLSARLTAIHAPRPYAVYHDAFAYFEARHGLAHVASFTEDEELKPGVRRLLELQRLLREQNVACILVEPGVNLEELRSVSTGQRFVTVDILATGFAAGRDAYTAFLRQLGEAFADCLS